MEDKLQTIPEIKSITDIVRYSDKLYLIKDCEPEVVHQSLMELIIEVFNYYGEVPNNVQIKLAANLSKEQFNLLTLSDIEIFKKKCLNSEYDLKFRLTPKIFCDWINIYINERNQIESEVISNSIIEKREKEYSEYSPKTVEFLKDISQRLQDKKPKPDLTPREPNVYELASKELQSYIGKEFRELWKIDKLELSVGSLEIPYVIYKGQKMFADAYLKARYSEIIAETKGDLNEINKLIK